MEAELLKLGLAGIVILAQTWAIKRLYTDLEDARDDLDAAREAALLSLERSFALALKRTKGQSDTSSEVNGGL